MLKHKHPGTILYQRFMEPHGLTCAALARLLLVPAQRIHQLVMKKRGLSPDTALRLEALFEPTAEQWMELQKLFELSQARKDIDTEELSKIGEHTISQPNAKLAA